MNKSEENLNNDLKMTSSSSPSISSPSSRSKKNEIPLLVELVNLSINSSLSKVYFTLFEDTLKIFSYNSNEINEIIATSKPIHEFLIKRIKIIQLMSPKAFTLQDQINSKHSIDIVCHSLSNANKILNFLQVLF